MPTGSVASAGEMSVTILIDSSKFSAILTSWYNNYKSEFVVIKSIYFVTKKKHLLRLIIMFCDFLKEEQVEKLYEDGLYGEKILNQEMLIILLRQILQVKYFQLRELILCNFLLSTICRVVNHVVDDAS